MMMFSCDLGEFGEIWGVKGRFGSNAVWVGCRGGFGIPEVSRVICVSPPPQRVLPHGYPESVSPDHLQDQCWDTVGVGDGASSITGATLTWVLRVSLPDPKHPLFTPKWPLVPRSMFDAQTPSFIPKFPLLIPKTIFDPQISHFEPMCSHFDAQISLSTLKTLMFHSQNGKSKPHSFTPKSALATPKAFHFHPQIFLSPQNPPVSPRNVLV